MTGTGANDLGGFLRSRRERLTPDAAGIELALLVGASGGCDLSKGASSSASDAVVDTLAVALRLDRAKHEHLRILAAPRRPAHITMPRDLRG
ncbi:MAG: hypothetical protein ABW215_20365 [Kibdelosporangium sp.]